MTAPAFSSLSPENWERRYQENTTRWDLGQPAPPLAYLLQADDAPQPGKAVVLGAGRGHDALLFAKHGFEVTAVDFAPSAIAATAAQAKAANVSVRLLQQDIFTLLPEHAGQFDYVVEHTCFCALDPGQRSAYVNLVADLLKPQGELLALFFTHSRPGGPPYGSHPDEIRNLFQSRFDLLSLQTAINSIPSRQGDEHLGRFRRR
jgi:SAM-dependent methyltransferase